ncbi:hypothetical protein [Spirosoma oryzicola]|uniref:hypothetical protein n=1 Tax=Spirosoma oryzicola TaxID=2898794 RepID=UPI001E5EBA52|nr:hypothetical protein [Spirosoma oryzicola]UHG93382.1 hypothetical protein LQ777_10865 [Spirosoma oryzicola]
MALNLNEEATLKIKSDTGQFNADLKALNDRATELTKTLKEIEKTGPGKNSDEWRKFKTELDDTRKASEALRKDVDITTLSYGQLENHVKQLARDLKTLKPGTDEFIAASAKLQTARQYLDNVTASTKNVSTNAKQAAKDLTTMADSGLTFGELRTKIEQLKTKLDGLTPGTKEFIATSKQLTTTKQLYDSVKDSVDDATQALHKQLLEAKNSELTYGQLEAKVKLLNEQLKKLKPGTDDFVKATKQLGEAEKDFKAVGKQVDDVKKSSDDLGKPTLWQKITSGVGGMQTAFQAFFALQIVGYIIDIGKAIFETTAKFEKYEKVLTNALGSQKQAQESMEALKELGSKTAFSVDELTEGYVKMVNRGLRPSKAEMVALTDLAASQGKTFDQLVEGLLDAATGEFERLKEFGTRASKAGEEVTFKFKNAQLVVKNTSAGFEVLDKVTGKVVNTFKNQEDATLGVMTALGEMKGVQGQNAAMMQTLDGKTSNLGDSMDALKVAVGDRLKPVFLWLLDFLSTGVQWMLKIAVATEPLVTVFADLFDAIGALAGSLQPIVQRIFPNMISGGTALNTTMKVVALAFRAVITPVQAAIAVLIGMGQTFGGVVQAARALEKYLSGDVVGGKAAWEQAKKTFTQVGDTAKVNFNAIANGWKNAMVDTPKKVAPEAIFAAKDTEAKRQEGMTDEQKKAQAKREKEAEKARKKELKDHEKALEDVRKANQKALELLAKEEAEAHIAGIKDEMQREFAKLQAKRDLEAEDIMRGLQSETIKNQQIANLDLKLQADITRVAGEYAEKKRKKAEEEEKKRLDNQKFIAEQERQAYAALYDWQEMTVQAKLDSQVISSATAATQLAAIHHRRVDSELAASLAKNTAEEAAERAKAIREATSKEQEGVMLTAIEARFENERIVLTQQAADTKAKIERDLKEKKNAIWSEASNAFSALLKGDLMAFVEHASNIVKGEKEAWQKRIEENMAKYQAVAQMATAAVQFLNQLEQQKAANAIAAAKKERDEKVALIQELIATEKAAQDAAEMEKQRVTQESNNKISAIKSASESAISSLEQQYRQLSSTAEKKKLDEQLQGYKENADGKSEAAKDAAQEAIEAAQNEAKQSIDAAQKAEKEAIKSATNEKNEKIDAAEATRDAEIAAINKRKDIDQATRKQLLADAKAAFETTKEQTEAEAKDKIEKAKDTAKTQTELAKDTQKTKIELAKDQQEAELKAIEAVQKGDEKAAKEILAKAKEDQKEKIRLAKEEADKKIEEAEKEKREKLKKVEQEKQTRIQNQKELNRQIEAENKKAAATEAAAKRKAWEAQKKADIASALITGALATLKALASSFWPANLVFAAMSAVMTGVQVAMIKSQPAPQFAKGGFIPQGGRHGASYGTGGIGLIDRQSGRDVGEMEGGEAIISREQTQANMPLIQRMFANARTPGRRGRSVLADRDALGHPAWGQPAGFRDGGLLNPPSWPGRMYLYGGIPGRATPGRGKRYDDGGMTDEGYSDNYGGSDNYSGYDDAEARAAADRAEKQGLEQLRLLTAIKDALEKEPETMRQLLMNLENNLRTAMANVAFSQWINDSNNNRSLLTGLETLGTNLSSALTRISTSQTTDSKVIVAELTTLRNSLLLSINEHRSQLVATLGTNRLTNTLAISSLTLQLVSSLKALSTDTTQAVGNLEETTVRELQQLSTDTTRSLSSLEKTTATELQRHSTNTTKSLSSLEKTTATGLDKLATQSKTDFTQLTDKLQRNQDEATAKTILAMSAASTANQKALASLSLKTVTSLDNLSDEMKTTLLDLKKATVNSLDELADSTETALALLDKDMTKALALLSQNVTRSLDVLDEDVTGSLDTLNKDQKQALGTLGYRTETALDRSATRTTQSVDSLSVEVRSLKGSINSVEGAVWQVRGAVDGVQGAVWGSNQAGRLDALIGAISTFGGK